MAESEARKWFRAQSTARGWSGIAIVTLGALLAAVRVLTLWSLAVTVAVAVACFVVSVLARTPGYRGHAVAVSGLARPPHGPCGALPSRPPPTGSNATPHPV
ncbi:hypothetical protein [Sinomonas flava]|uniref:hypothetical protein n=1 Tax=Sinomonas flava TaxID=496857 RepID=UPI0031D63114